MRKVERLVNLLSLLLVTRRPLTIDEIRRMIPGYEEGSDEAFRRMFERDKQELRDLGVPLERAATDVWEIEEGYLIRQEEALLGDVGLTPDEVAALAIAARAWSGGGDGDGAPGTALLKLAAASGGGDPAGGGWILPTVDASEPNLEPLMDAMSRRKRVTFTYRTGGAGAGEQRTVDPYGLRYRAAWYLTGFDHARGEVRHFKISRIDGAVAVASGAAPDFDAPEGPPPPLPRGPWEGETTVEARVAFAPEVAWWAERRTGAQRAAERDDGWVEVAMPVADAERFATWILGFGDHAVVLSPAEVRDEVVRRLERLCGGER